MEIKEIVSRAHDVCSSSLCHCHHSAWSAHIAYVSHVFLYGIYVSLPRQQKGQWDLREKCPAFLICDQKLNTDQLKQCNFLNCFFPDV